MEDKGCIQVTKIALIEETTNKSLPRIENKIDEIYKILQGELDKPGLVSKVEILQNTVETNIKDNFIRVWTAIGGVWAVVIFVVGFLLVNGINNKEYCDKKYNEPNVIQQSK